MRLGCLGYFGFAALAPWVGAACSNPAAFPSASQAAGLPCPGSEVHALVQQGRLHSALRHARAASLARPHVRSTRPEGFGGVCVERQERAALIAQVLAELGACAEARDLSRRPLDCRPEPLPVDVALARAAELRRSGRASDAARLSARAVQAALTAGMRVRAIPALPRPVAGVPVELTALEDVLVEQREAWQSEPSVYFLAGSACVGASCLLPGGRVMHMPGAELVSGFAPRRFDYPWRMHPARGLVADADGIVDLVAGSEVPLDMPAGVAPNRLTGERLADVAFSRDGSSVWALGWPGRLFAVNTRSGQPLADFDLTRECPRVQDPFRIVTAAAADVAIAQVGPAPGCASLIRPSRASISALPFAPGALLALSGDGLVAATHHQGRVTIYDLGSLQWLDPPPARSFAAPEAIRLALSYDGSTIALVVPGKEVELPDGGVELWAAELRLLQPNGVPLPGHEPWGIGFAGMLADGDFGARAYSFHNAIFDYRGTLRAVLIARNASVLAAFSDGTLEAFGPEARDLYRCAIDGARFPAADCADFFERSGQLGALVDAQPAPPGKLRRFVGRR